MHQNTVQLTILTWCVHGFIAHVMNTLKTNKNIHPLFTAEESLAIQLSFVLRYRYCRRLENLRGFHKVVFFCFFFLNILQKIQILKKLKRLIHFSWLQCSAVFFFLTRLPVVLCFMGINQQCLKMALREHPDQPPLVLLSLHFFDSINVRLQQFCPLRKTLQSLDRKQICLQFLMYP